MYSVSLGTRHRAAHGMPPNVPPKRIGYKRLLAESGIPATPNPHKLSLVVRGYPKKSNGGAERDRTADLCVANAALSQLSYGPTKLAIGARPSFYVSGQACGLADVETLGSLTTSVSGVSQARRDGRAKDFGRQGTPGPTGGEKGWPEGQPILLPRLDLVGSRVLGLDGLDGLEEVRHAGLERCCEFVERGHRGRALPQLDLRDQAY